MVGLVPAIHVFGRGKEDVDARDKPGHDEWEGAVIARSEATTQSIVPYAERWIASLRSQ
jgi:hypothetical protein